VAIRSRMLAHTHPRACPHPPVGHQAADAARLGPLHQGVYALVHRHQPLFDLLHLLEHVGPAEGGARVVGMPAVVQGWQCEHARQGGERDLARRWRRGSVVRGHTKEINSAWIVAGSWAGEGAGRREQSCGTGWEQGRDLP
jgi:hypothetical protein